MRTLDARTQIALYKAHKGKIHGSDILEIGIPDFHDLDTSVSTGKNTPPRSGTSVDLKDQTGQNLFIDIGNATPSGETVFQVQKEDKNEAIQAIDSWIKRYFNIHITWSNDQQYEATIYRLNPKSRMLASQLTAIAQKTTHGQRKPIAQSPRPKPTPKPPATNAWINSTQVKEQPQEFEGKTLEKKLENEGMLTTLSKSTWHSLSCTTQETSEKFKKWKQSLQPELLAQKARGRP